MKFTYFFALVLLFSSCHSGNESSTDTSTDNKSEKTSKDNTDDVAPEHNSYPSDEWVIAKFTDGDLGFMTPDEESKIKGNYSFLRKFSNHFAAVRDSKSKKMGLIDEAGGTKIPFSYEYMSAYANGLIAVRKGEKDKVGYIDIEGKEIVEARYTMGFAFNNGLARVAKGKYEDAMSMKRWETAKYGFINNKGEEIVPLNLNWASDFQNGIAAVQKGTKYYFIDSTGAKVDAKTYKRLSGFKGDLCAAANGSKMGFINREMELVIPMEYTNYMYFFDVASRFSFGSNKESELGATKFQNDDGYLFLEKGKNWGIVNIKNEVLTPFEYSNIEAPTGFGFVKYQKKNKYGYGRLESGKIVEIIPAEFDYIFHYNDNELITVGKGKYPNQKQGAYSLKGKEIVPPKYDRVSDIGKGYASVEKNEKYGIYNSEGKQITELIYEYIGTINEDLEIHVKKGEEYIYVNKEGKEIKK